MEHEQSPTDYQTRKITKFFSTLFLIDQDDIYRDAKLPHCQKKEEEKKALQNMKTNRRNRDC